MTTRGLNNAVQNLRIMQSYVESKGSQFIVTIVPNKNTLYGEYMPMNQKEGLGEGNLERIAPMLEEAGITYVDLQKAFNETDEVLYYKEDSHWSNKGAVLAYESFMDAIMEKVDRKIAERNSQIVRELGGQVTDPSGGVVNTFTVVTLSEGQVLTGSIGCEVMLRVGTAVCVSPSSPGLVDETAASTLNNGGALVQNHLYMMTIEGRGVKATAATTKVLVRGTYQVA
jgi:hypothetical protein